MGFGWLNGTTDFASWYWRYGAATTPAAALVALAAVVWVLHRLRAARVGDYRDPEVQKRGASRLVGFGLRHLFAWATKPMVSLLVMAGVGPTAVTGLSAILSIASGVALGAGWFGLGGWLYLLSGVCDFLDGRIARVSGRATARGAALDSILDRYGEAAVLTGLAYYFRGSWVLLIAVVTLAGSLLVSYVRARGEGLGVQFPNVGLMQRPERVLLVGVSAVLSPVTDVWFRRPGFAMPVVAMLLVLAVTTHWTTIVRLRYVWKALGDAEKEPGSPPGWRASIWGLLGASVFDAAYVAGLARSAHVPVALSASAGFAVAAVFWFGWQFPWAEVEVALRRRFVFLAGTSSMLVGGGTALFEHIGGLHLIASGLLAHGLVLAAWTLPIYRGLMASASGAGRKATQPRAIPLASQTDSDQEGDRAASQLEYRPSRP